jgi:hypothetical protein
MNAPEWLKPGIYGAVVGAIALAVVGFSWGGWVTGGTAQKLANDQARQQVVAALVPICLEQSKQDPRLSQTLAALEAASNYKRSGMIMDAGWATMPGSSDPDSAVAGACMEKLAEQF